MKKPETWQYFTTCTRKQSSNNYSIRLTSPSQPLLKLHCYCHHHFLPDHYHLMKSNLDQRGIATPVISDQINIRLSTWIVSTYTSFIFQVILSHCMYKQTKWCCKQCWLVENNPIPKHCLLSQEQVLDTTWQLSQWLGQFHVTHQEWWVYDQ